MKSLIRGVSVVGAIFVLGFFLLAGFLTYQSQTKLQQSRDLVMNTSSLMMQLQSVISTLKDCETGQRGYVITGDPKYLEPYEKCHSIVNGLLDKLEMLIDGDAEDRQRVEKVKSLAAFKLTELQQTIELRRNYGFEAAQKVVITDVGKKVMDDIRSIINDMENKQDKILHQRLQILADESATSRLYSLILIVLGVLSLIGTLLLISKLVAELQRTEEALSEREAHLSAILNTAAEGIISMSSEGIIESANSAVYKIFNYEPGTLIGKDVRLILPQFSEAIEEKSANKNGNAFIASSIETEGVNRNGLKLPIEIAYSAVELGNKKMATSIVRDITERKTVERRVSEFYSTVSHELRTPLTSIRGSLSLMEGGRAGELSPRAQQLVKVAHSESERLIRLINDILDIKKIEVGKLELKLELVKPSELVNDAIESLSGFADEAGIKISSQINTTGKLYCDKDRIEQVLSNLLSNAIKFSPAGGEVTIIIDDTESKRYRFSILDNGSGIPANEMHRLFGLFQQLDPSDSRRKGGTGLGLAISKALIEKHNGTIGVESTVNKGSVFWFELPAINADMKMPVRIDYAKPGLLYKANSTVLIVEDDAILADLLSMMLEDENFIAFKAGSIREAEAYLQSHNNPDVIILDLNLPDGDGITLLDKLHQGDKTTNIPIVIVSGREPNMDTYRYPLLIDWIKKPFDEKRLLSALSLALKKRPKGRAKVLIVEDDKSTREVIKQNLESLNVETIEAIDGVSAVYYARSEHPDLIVLDLGIPSLDGFEVVQILRKENIQTPLIVYTARDLTEGDKKELTLGLTSHLIKSRTTEKELLETVKNMLNGLLEGVKTCV